MPSTATREHMSTQTIVFGGGCFWCTEAVFQSLRGVVSVVPGYAGGHTENPTYEDICTGTTGHAEVVRVEYNPEEISIKDLLTVFFATHDPTQLNKQGADVGTQYRSVIFFTTEEQEKQAREMIADIERTSHLGGPIVTEIAPLPVFYPAEEYHKNYFARNPEKAYCQIVINPKIEKVQERFAQLLISNSQK